MKYKAFKITPVKKAVTGLSRSKPGESFQKLFEACSNSLQTLSRTHASLPIHRPSNLAVLTETINYK